MDAILRIPYAEKEAAKAAARTAGGRLAWNAEDKTWTYTGPALPAALRPYRQDSRRTRTFLLDVPFAQRSEAQAAGARWDGDHKSYLWSGTSVPAALSVFRAPAYSWERLREDTLNGGAERQASTGDGMRPRPHQDAAIRTIHAAVAVGRRGFLLADDVGVGKTVSALEAALRLEDVSSLLIVCPLAVVEHWRQTVTRLGDRGKRIVVINYDRLSRLFDAPEAAPARAGRSAKKKRTPSARTLNKRKAAKGELMAEFDAVILDESHRLRNLQTLRAKYAARVADAAQFTLWLSATAGQNPLELSYLAPLLAEVTGARVRDVNDFEVWCQAQGIGIRKGAYGKWTWDSESPTAEADLELVRRLLFEGRVPAGLRRRPEDIAGWPEINRVAFPVSLEGENRALYLKEWAAFRQAMRLAGGRTRAESKNALVARLRFRQKASLLRVPGTLALIEDLIENRHQVAVSVEFLETLEAVRAGVEALGETCAVIHGNLTGPEREAQRRAFQQGRARVVVYTVTEGISLHAGDESVRATTTPRANVIADVRYSAIAQAQIEGRCHRDGQNATVYYVYGSDTVEETVVQTAIGRMKTMKTMIGDDTRAIRAMEALLWDAVERDEAAPSV